MPGGHNFRPQSHTHTCIYKYAQSQIERPLNNLHSRDVIAQCRHKSLTRMSVQNGLPSVNARAAWKAFRRKIPTTTRKLIDNHTTLTQIAMTLWGCFSRGDEDSIWVWASFLGSPRGLRDAMEKGCRRSWTLYGLRDGLEEFFVRFSVTKSQQN